MTTGRIRNRQVMEVVAWSEAAGVAYPDGLTEATVDALLEEVDRELTAERHVASARVSRDFVDQRQAHRAARRAERSMLRSLPARVNPVDLGGEAA